MLTHLCCEIVQKEVIYEDSSLKCGLF